MLKKSLVEIDCFDIFHLILSILLKKIWEYEDGSRKNDMKNIKQIFASTFLTAPTEMCLLKPKTAKGAQKRKMLAENRSPSALGPPRLPFGMAYRHSRWTAQDEEVGRATWEQCRTALFWTAWMKMGKPDLRWIWNCWWTWETARWTSRGTKGSLRNRLLGEAGKSPSF